MGTVPNVGLMAQKAEEYGSHDKTFEIAAAGHRPRSSTRPATVLLSTRSRPATSGACLPGQGRAPSATGSSWPSRARATGFAPAVFWLDETAPTTPSSSRRSSSLPARARHRRPRDPHPGAGRGDQEPLERMRAGKDTISVTGNVLRDYLTDLFPILELGTSAKMLSIVPLMKGRRAVRDRRRRLGAEARAAVREGEPPALGLARRVPRARPSSFEHIAAKSRQPGRKISGEASTRDRRRTCSTTRARRARSTSSTTAAATFYLATLLGPRPSRSSRSDDADLAKRFGAGRGRTSRRRRKRRSTRNSTGRAGRARGPRAATSTSNRAKLAEQGDAAERDAVQRDHRRDLMTSTARVSAR